MDSNNFYVEGVIALLDLPIEIDMFANEDATGYYTIPEYIATYGHTVEQFNGEKTRFIKGLLFTMNDLDDFRLFLADSIYNKDIDYDILNYPEVLELVGKPEWTDEGVSIDA